MESASKRLALVEAETNTCVSDLPRELVHVIWEARARARLLDYLEGLIKRLDPVRDPSAPDYAMRNQAIRRFVPALCRLLQDNKAVISGSTCVLATSGPFDVDWTPGDVDIFVRASTMQPHFNKCLLELLDGIRPTDYKISFEWQSRPDYTNISAARVASYRIWPASRLPGEEAIVKFQIIVLAAGHKTPFCENLDKLPLGQQLYELFDIKLCASYFDGQDFYTADYKYAIHGASRVMPRGKHGEDIADATPRQERLYQLKQQSSPIAVIPALTQHDPLHGANNHLRRAVHEWVTANELCGWPTYYDEIERLTLYLDRGLTLLLNTPFAQKPSDACVTIIDSRGLVGRVSQSRLALDDRQYTCEWVPRKK